MNFYSTQAAAEHLAGQFGETVDYWITRLANMRNPKRKVSYRLNFAATEGRLGMYAEEDLRAFTEFEKTRRIGDIKLSPRAAEALHAFGIGQPGGSTTGRKLKYAATIQPSNDSTSNPFVQLLIKDPLLVFRLDQGEFNVLVADLCELKAHLDRYITEAQQ
jgi:hypothetical protein